MGGRPERPATVSAARCSVTSPWAWSSPISLDTVARDSSVARVDVDPARRALAQQEIEHAQRVALARRGRPHGRQRSPNRTSTTSWSRRLVVVAAVGQDVELAGLGLERVGLAQARGRGLAQLRRRRRRQRLLDLGQRVEMAGLLGQRGVGADAAAGEVPHARLVLVAVGMGVEVAGPVVPGELEQAHEMEGLLEVLGAEAEVLVIAADPLAVEVDVEQLARPQRLPDAMHERQPGHRLVRHLGVDAHHLGAVQHRDEVQRMAHGGQEDVAAGLVGLGLDGELQLVALLDHVVGQQVDRLAVTLERVARVLGHAHLGALAPAPEDVDLGAELGPEVDGEHRLADRRPAHAAVVGGEGAVLERRDGRTGWSSPSPRRGRARSRRP